MFNKICESSAVGRTPALFYGLQITIKNKPDVVLKVPLTKIFSYVQNSVHFSCGQTTSLEGKDIIFTSTCEVTWFILFSSTEVEKDLAKLAEVGKMTSRTSNNPHSSLLHSPLRHRTLPDTLPLPSLVSRPQSPAGSLSGKPCGIGLPLLSPKPTTNLGWTKSPSNPGSRTQTPRTPSKPLTPNSLLTRSTFNPGPHKEVTFRRSRSRPVTPTSQPILPRPLLTPPGLSTTDSLGASLRAYLSEVRDNTKKLVFTLLISPYQQLFLSVPFKKISNIKKRINQKRWS